MRADLFQPFDLFTQRMDQMIRDIRNAPLIEGVDRIYLPGEIENITLKERVRNGIPVSKEVIAELVAVAGKYNVKADLFKSLV